MVIRGSGFLIPTHPPLELTLTGTDQLWQLTHLPTRVQATLA